MPLEEDIRKAYRMYYTHSAEVPPEYNAARRFQCRMRDAYIRTKYHYRQNVGDRWTPFLALLAYLDPVRRGNFDFSVFYLDSKPDGRFLELGCGSGARLKSMQELGWHVEGVDFDPAAVDQVRKQGVAVHLGTLADQKFADESFDAITGIHFFEHNDGSTCPRQKWTLDRIHRDSDPEEEQVPACCLCGVDHQVDGSGD